MFAAGAKFAVQIIHIAVAVDKHICTRKTAAVDDGSVVQFVGKDCVPLPDKRGDRAHVRHIASTVEERGFRALELGKRAFKPHMRRLRASRKTRTARPCTKFIRGIRRRLDYARISREVEIVVRRKNDELATVDNSRRACRSLQRPTLAREPGRLTRVERISKAVESARRICRGRKRRDVIDEDRCLFKKLNRLCDSVARAAIEENAPAVWIALFLENCDSPIAEFTRRDIASHIVRIVRYADFGGYVRRILDLCRKDDRLGVVVLYARRSLRERRGIVHVCRAHAARLVWLKPFECVGIEQHRATKRMRL